MNGGLVVTVYMKNKDVLYVHCFRESLDLTVSLDQGGLQETQVEM